MESGCILGRRFLTGRSASPSVVSFLQLFLSLENGLESSECQELETRNRYFYLKFFLLE